MPDVVVGALLGLPGLHRQRLLGPVQRLDLGFLVDAEHDRVLRRVQIQPDDVGDLGDQLGVGGELERLRPPRLHSVMPPGPQHRRGIHLQVIGEQPRRPMRDTEPRRRRGQGGGQDLWPGPPSAADPTAAHRPSPSPRRRRSGPARRSPSAATHRPAQRSRCSTPHRRPATRSAHAAPNRPGSSSTASTTPTAHDHPDRRPNGCARIPHSRAPPLSNYFRRAALGSTPADREVDRQGDPQLRGRPGRPCGAGPAGRLDFPVVTPGAGRGRRP